MKKKISKPKGFTLLEIVLAISILSVITVITYTTLSNIIKAKKLLDDRRDTGYIANAILNRVAREFQLAFSSVALLPRPDQPTNSNSDTRINLIGEENPLDDGEFGDSIRFVALEGGQYLPDGGAHSGLVQIMYRVELDPESSSEIPQYLLVREETPIISPVEQAYQKIMVFPVAKGIVGFKIRYYNKEDDSWVSTWGSDGHFKLPAMIELTLRIRSALGEVSTYTTAVALRTIY